VDEYTRETRTDVVLKLASLPKMGIDAVLLRRNFDPVTVREAKAALAAVGTAFTAKEAVQYSFEKHGVLPAYGRGRFGDGTAPVFYSALEEETCVNEVRYHLENAMTAVPFSRSYDLLSCDFQGTIINLIGKEVDHPELISPTEDGYPFCRSLAQMARGLSIHAFYTRSARHSGGRCTPVFARPNLTNERSIAHATFVSENGTLKYEREPA
jgi:hypothetical protein